jgi:hypothetical protein
MQHRAYCRHLLQGETVEEHGTMLNHDKDNGAAARGSSDVTSAVHEGSGKQMGVNKASEPINFDPTSCLVRDPIHQVRMEQVIMTRSLSHFSEPLYLRILALLLHISSLQPLLSTGAQGLVCRHTSY